MAGASKNTVTKLLVDVGEACEEYQYNALRNLPCKRFQVDEIWSFCYAKEKNVPEELKGEFELDEDRFDLARLVEASRRLVKPHASKQGVGLKVADCRHFPPVHADKRRLKQVFINLLSNAIKFTPAGGEVSLAVRIDRRGRLELAVADSGLGLPIAKCITELHGGTLAIDSRKGVGTTVTVRLPKQRVLNGGSAA